MTPGADRKPKSIQQGLGDSACVTQAAQAPIITLPVGVEPLKRLDELFQSQHSHRDSLIQEISEQVQKNNQYLLQKWLVGSHWNQIRRGEIEMMSSCRNWQGLILSFYSKVLGATKGSWIDVFALDEDSLAGIPPPVVAVILLFPISEQYDQYCKEQDELVKEKGQEFPADLFYLKQCVSNACGTVGVIHALANNAAEIGLEDGILKEFMTETAGLSPQEKGQALANSEKEGTLYELDGRRARAGPINHGPTTPENLLKDAAKVCQSRMARDPTEYRFTVVAYTTSI
ncbi:unnamed protein product [Allacma fusca]|uniref:UCH catalytic domain-containing protein n=1 Tax=Allacma fusca TaxID=39272 RepID=A0A8J2PXL5_9HEXA|nr:unnamed protein product [Allacma fusca]